MEDRIEINGVWYVREAEQDLDEGDVTEFKGCVYETDEYCWEATKLLKYDDKYYDEIDIKFTDKSNKPWLSDHWDSNVWMKGVLRNDPESIKEAKTSMSKEGVAAFKWFLKILQNKGWFN